MTEKEGTQMNKKQELLDYIMSLSPEQADKLVQRLDLLKKVVNMSEPEAIYTNTLTGKLFFGE